MAALLVAAADVAPALIWPPDVHAVLLAGFRARLDRLGPEVRARAADRYQQALAVARFAARAPALL
jgi:hypothetical protein